MKILDGESIFLKVIFLQVVSVYSFIIIEA